MRALAADPTDDAAEAVAASVPTYNAMLRTTCVATTIAGGHATNAIPQRATAAINCRIFPGNDVEQTRLALASAIDDPAVSLTLGDDASKPVAAPPPLNDRILRPAQQVAERLFPACRWSPPC